MFPPRQHNTGIQALDNRLNHFEEEMKNGYNTGNKDRDTELNASHQRGLERDEEAGRQHSMSGTEYHDAEQARHTFADTDESKELWQKYEQTFEKDNNGQHATAASHEAWKNYVQAENKYMKDNCNKQTYDNYCKINKERLGVLNDESK